MNFISNEHHDRPDAASPKRSILQRDGWYVGPFKTYKESVAAPPSDAAQPEWTYTIEHNLAVYNVVGTDKKTRARIIASCFKREDAERIMALYTHPEDAPEGRPKVTITKPSHEWVLSVNGHLVWSSTDSCGLQWQAEQIAAALGVQLNRDVRDKGEG